MLEPDKCPVRERKMSVGQRTKLLPRGYVALRKILSISNLLLITQ